jgi:hypothetical protein
MGVEISMDLTNIDQINGKLDLIRMRDIPRLERTIETSEMNRYAPLLNSININLHNIWLENHIQSQLLARISLQLTEQKTNKKHKKTNKDKDNEIFCEEVLKGDYNLPDTILENICELEL